MKIAFRVDASQQIGSGHVMRCLTLAESLREQGAQILFVCRDLPGNLNVLIKDKDFGLSCLPAPAKVNLELDWNRHAAWLEVPWQQDADETSAALQGLGGGDLLVVDHYALGKDWELTLHHLVDKILVIDDLADRLHDCDFLLDQNLYAGYEKRYEGLVPDRCLQFLGPRYALLRPDFRQARENLCHRTGVVNRILVFFGGTDPTDETTKALDAIRHLDRDELHVDVVVGMGNNKKDAIQDLCKSLPQTHFYCQVPHMAELLASADLSLGAGGSTTWERFAVGTPSLLIAVAHNQVQHSRDLGNMGLAIYLGRSDEVDENMIQEQLERVFNRPELLQAMARSGLELVDGLGTTRLATALFSRA